MLRKKFYIPIGILIVAICAIGLLSLRSDVPEKPIQIYKATLTETPATDETAETKTAETGHVDEDGTRHAQPHTAGDSPTTYEQLLTEKEPLKSAIEINTEILKEEREKYQNLLGRYEELKEQSEIREEVKAFDTWVSTINFQQEFGELLALPSLPPETIRELYTPEELEVLVVESVARFNAFRAEFLTRLENCPPEAREIIESHINASPELSEIYVEYIEKPFEVSGGFQQ